MVTRLFYNELKIIPYTQRRDVSNFESKTADLNSFLKDDMHSTKWIFLCVLGVLCAKK